MTGIGPLPVKAPRVRDRAAGAEKVRFTSSILPPYLRKAQSIEELLPWLYLTGISSGDFQEALSALLGPNAAGPSSTTISRRKAAWWDEYERWQRRDLGARRIVYIRADGVYFQPRMVEEKRCVLVVIGADEWGRKEVPGLADGYRESTQSWRELLIDLKRRGLTRAPELAIGDGALGFRAALREVFGSTREQRCRVHKTGNIPNAMPKSVQPKAKGRLHDIRQAETKAEAEAAFDFFTETYGVKYDKAVTNQLLRLPGGTLETHSDLEPDREHLRHRPSPHPQDQGLLEPKNPAGHGLQADDVGAGKMAKAGPRQSAARDRPGDCLQGRHQATSSRRLITPSPTFGHSSPA